MLNNQLPWRYVIVSPARNEELLIATTIQSVIEQTILPVKYIIVNDGSTDNTAKIAEAIIKNYSWIELINLPDRGYYTYGNGIIAAFKKGLATLQIEDYDFIVKMDSDLSFDKKYFENIIYQFSEEPRLGMCSGQTYYLNNKSKLVWEDAPVDHVVGPCKMYRRSCFEDIGGPVMHLGWDHIDVITAKMKGWITKSYPEYRIIHHRAMGSRLGVLKGNMRHGRADYITGYNIPYFILKTFYRLFQRPYLIGSLASFYGFFSYYFIGKERIVSKEFRLFYQRDQMSKLFKKDFWKLYFLKFGVIKRH